MSKYLFKAPCPVLGCKNSSKDISFQWYHADCGKKMYVRSDGYLVCDCGQDGEMIDWNYKCEYHDYEQASEQGLLLALSVLATLQNINVVWVLDTTDKVSAQCRKAINDNKKNTYSK